MDIAPIENKVANSSLITLDLEDYYPQGDRVVYDLADNLFQGMILREKDFREFIKSHDWSTYEGKHVAITCTADAIVPTWAYMLLTVHLVPFARTVIEGDLAALELTLFQKAISAIQPEDFHDKKIVIKGCGNLPVPAAAYVELTRLLQPSVTSIMFGEPCSTVPVYKKKRK